MSKPDRRIDIEEISGVTVARLLEKKILDEANIQELGQELFQLVEEENRKSLLLNFSSVEFLSSAALGKLITLDKKVKTNGGRLKLSNIRPEIYEVFAITKLNKLFRIMGTRAEALDIPRFEQATGPGEWTIPSLRGVGGIRIRSDSL